jgi:hypothetical protein
VMLPSGTGIIRSPLSTLNEWVLFLCVV